MLDQIYLVKWKSGSFSFLFSAKEGMFCELDKIGAPSDAEVRIVPPELMQEVTFDQKEDSGYFEISVDVEHMLWRECTKQVWPLESLGS
jgi:hypothetical protein